MAYIDHYPAGSFCWIGLATTDQNDAKRFCSSLFGWDPQDSPIGPEGVGRMAVIADPQDAAFAIFKSARHSQGG